MRLLSARRVVPALLWGAITACCFADETVAEKPPVLDLPALVRACLERGERTVVIPRGVHRLPETGVRLAGISDIVIDGAGATLLATSFRQNALALRDCRNVTLRGFTLDYDPLPFTQATITRRAGDGRWLEFRMHDGYAALEGEYAVRRAHVFDGATRLWKKNAPDLYPTAVRMTGPREGRVELNLPAGLVREIQAGDLLAFNVRRSSAIMLGAGCEDICVEEVTVHSAPGAAIIARFVAGEKNTFRRVVISRGPTPPGATEPRLLSASADGINYAYARHGPLIERCEFSFHGDDSINLHGVVFPVVKRDGPRVLWTMRPVSGDPFERIVRAGDALRLLAPDTFLPGAGLAIKSFERADLPGDWSATARAVWPSFKQQTRLTFYKVTLAEDSDAPAAGAFFDIPATFSPRYAIRDCHFHDHRAHGMRIMAPHGVIENNRVERVRGTAIGLAGEYVFWREAGWPRDVRVAGNIIRDAGQGAGFGTAVTPYIRGAVSLFAHLDPATTPAPGCLRDIVIEDNVIEVENCTGIDINAASDVVVRRNRVRISSPANTDAPAPLPVAVSHSERVSIE
ncbi:MAG: hypothetical protein LBI02_06985 [Opitutaceae bacterium]|jgi:hypothetical protein|nr:hypothetical protein [Opitutaceae bacterium]